MIEIIYLSGPSKKSAKGAEAFVKCVRTSEGQIAQIWSVDIRSTTFGEDLRYVFAKNVAQARRENIAVTGSADGHADER